MRKTLSVWVIGALLALVGYAAAYRAGWVRVNAPRETEFPVRGVDVSRHQGKIDWRAVARSGVAFAFLKATEGKDFRDPEFASHWEATAAAGVLRGAYHFYTFCTPGGLQAAHFIAVVPADPTSLPPVVDVEFVGNCTRWQSVEVIRAELARFLSSVEAHYGRRVILYFTAEAHRRILAGHFEGRRLWPRAVFSRPSARFGTWTFWQYADNGRIPGIRGPVDLDVFRGSAGELAGLRSECF